MIISRTILLQVALLGLLITAMYSHAQTITVPVSSQGEYLGSIERPRLGQSQAEVTAQFGSPVSTQAAKGNPPIARWDYPNFSVYFENDSVLQSVLKHRQHKDQPLGDSTIP